MYNEILTKCREIADKIDDSAISDMVKNAETAISSEHKLNITIASGSPDHIELMNIAKDLCGKSISDKYPKMLRRAIKLTLTYGEKESLAAIIDGIPIEFTDENRDDVFEETVDLNIVHALPCEFLKDADITIWNGIHTPNGWQELLENTDILFLSMNATMALSSTEREWINTCVLPLYGTQQFAVILNRMDLVNTESDCEELRKSIKSRLGKFGEGIKIFEDITALKSHVSNSIINSSKLNELRLRRIMLNLVSSLKTNIGKLLNDVDTNIATAENATKLLENSRKELEAAGKVAAENTVSNIFADFKFKAIDSVEEYSDTAKNSILKVIRSASDLDSVSENVEPYLENIWKNYDVQFSKKMSEAREEAIRRLMKQMEFDTDSIIKKLDIATIELIEKIIFDSNIPNIPLSSELEANVSTRAKSVTKTVNGMILASVPLFFLNPIYGFASLAGSLIYKRSQKTSILEDNRKQLAESVEKYCDEIKMAAKVSVTEGLENEAAECQKNVMEAYSSLIDLLIDEIQKYANRIKAISEKRVILETALNEQLPDMINNL